MQKLKLNHQEEPPKFITTYTAKFQDALQMLQTWYKSQPTNPTMEGQIESWIRTCKLHIKNQYFNEQQHWKLPTFQSRYLFNTHLYLH
jgi:hypothetical protein